MPWQMFDAGTMVHCSYYSMTNDWFVSWEVTWSSFNAIEQCRHGRLLPGSDMVLLIVGFDHRTLYNTRNTRKMDHWNKKDFLKAQLIIVFFFLDYQGWWLDHFWINSKNTSSLCVPSNFYWCLRRKIIIFIYFPFWFSLSDVSCPRCMLYEPDIFVKSLIGKGKKLSILIFFILINIKIFNICISIL